MAYIHKERVILKLVSSVSYAKIYKAKMVDLQVSDGTVEVQVNLFLKSEASDQTTIREERTMVISQAPNIIGEIVDAKLHNINIYDDDYCEVSLDVDIVTVGMALQL